MRVAPWVANAKVSVLQQTRLEISREHKQQSKRWLMITGFEDQLLRLLKKSVRRWNVYSCRRLKNTESQILRNSQPNPSHPASTTNDFSWTRVYFLFFFYNRIQAMKNVLKVYIFTQQCFSLSLVFNVCVLISVRRYRVDKGRYIDVDNLARRLLAPCIMTMWQGRHRHVRYLHPSFCSFISAALSPLFTPSLVVAL